MYYLTEQKLFPNSYPFFMVQEYFQDSGFDLKYATPGLDVDGFRTKVIEHVAGKLYPNTKFPEHQVVKNENFLFKDKAFQFNTQLYSEKIFEPSFLKIIATYKDTFAYLFLKCSPEYEPKTGKDDSKREDNENYGYGKINTSVPPGKKVSIYSVLMLLAKLDLFTLGLDERGVDKLRAFCEWLCPRCARFSKEFNYDMLSAKAYELSRSSMDKIYDKTSTELDYLDVGFSDFVFILCHVAYEFMHSGANNEAKLRKNLDNKFHMKLPPQRLEEVYLKKFRIYVNSQEEVNSDWEYEDEVDSDDDFDPRGALGASAATPATGRRTTLKAIPKVSESAVPLKKRIDKLIEDLKPPTLPAALEREEANPGAEWDPRIFNFTEDKERKLTIKDIYPEKKGKKGKKKRGKKGKKGKKKKGAAEPAEKVELERYNRFRDKMNEYEKPNVVYSNCGREFELAFLKDATYPPQFDPEKYPDVGTCINSAVTFYCGREYEKALKLVTEAYNLYLSKQENPSEAWDNVKGLGDFTREMHIEIFFRLSRGQIYDCLDQDYDSFEDYEYLVKKYFRTGGREVNFTLVLNSLAYVLYYSEYIHEGLRLLLECKDVREQWLGVESIDTATVYNNIGCFFFKLDRREEATVWVEMCHAILEDELDLNNPRLRLVKSNLDRVKRYGVRRLNEPKAGWMIVKNPGKKKGKGKAKGAAKKKK